MVRTLTRVVLTCRSALLGALTFGSASAASPQSARTARFSRAASAVCLPAASSPRALHAAVSAPRGLHSIDRRFQREMRMRVRMRDAARLELPDECALLHELDLLRRGMRAHIISAIPIVFPVRVNAVAPPHLQ